MHWKINALIFLLQIIFAATAVLPNIMMMQMTQGIIHRRMDVFLFWMILELAVLLFQTAVNCLRTWAKSRAIRAMNNDLRSDIAATLICSEHREFHAKQSGEHLSRLTNDVTQVQTLAWDSFYGIISVTAQVIFSCLALGSMHWSLLLMSGVATLFMLFTPGLMSKRMEKLSEAHAAAQGQATGKMKDLLAGMDVLRTYGHTQRFLLGSKEASDIMEAGRHKFTCSKTYTEETMGLINMVTQIGNIVLIAFLSINGTIIQGAIIGGGNMVSTISGGVGQIMQRILDIQSSKPYFDKITVHAENLTESLSPVTDLQNSITVENLSFSYGDKPILHNANFIFNKGGKYALTGPSGCGKSTLLKLLLGWLPGYSGFIRFDGRDARHSRPYQLLQAINYIEQDVFLFNSTILDNITLGGDFTREQLTRAIRYSALEEDLTNMPLGLDSPVGEDGNSLSGGQKQRIAIARALIHDRSILLIDEGTSALDRKNAEIVEESLLQNPDLTLILVSHHLTEERKSQFTKVYQMEPLANA